MVLNVKYGYNRFIRSSTTNPGNWGIDLTTLGFSKQFQDQVSQGQQTRFPGINMTGFTATDHQDFLRPIDTHAFLATVTKMQGAHSWRTLASALPLAGLRLEGLGSARERSAHLLETVLRMNHRRFRSQIRLHEKITEPTFGMAGLIALFLP